MLFTGCPIVVPYNQTIDKRQHACFINYVLKEGEQPQNLKKKSFKNCSRPYDNLNEIYHTMCGK